MDPRLILHLRYGLLGTLLLFSLITLGLSGHILSLFTGGLIIPDYLGLDLAIAVITLVVVTPCIVIDFFRKGAFTSMVATELGWSFVLTILWIAAAGESTAARAGASCDFTVRGFNGEVLATNSAASAVCHEAQGLIALSWLNFLILLGWLVTLITLTVTAHTRGNTSVWTGPVLGTDFFAHKAQGQGVQPGYAGVPQQQYMQQQYTGTPVQQQYTGTPVEQHHVYAPQAGYPPTPPVGTAQV